MASDCKPEIRVFSNDGKANVYLGVEAVSKHVFKHRRMRYRVSLPSHNCGSSRSVKPEGFLELDTGSATVAKDSLGRQHYTYQRNGNLHMYLRANNFCESNSLTHTNDFLKELEGNTAPVVVEFSDNGDNRGPSSLFSVLRLGRIMKTKKLEAIGEVSPSADASSDQPIERHYAHVSYQWAGHVFGTDNSMSKEDDINMHRQALAAMAKAVESKRAGYRVWATPVDPVGKEAPYDDYELQQRLFKSSNKDIKKDPALLALYKEFIGVLSHADRRRNMLWVIRCLKADCETLRCHELGPIRAVKFFTLLRQWNGRVFTQVPRGLLPKEKPAGNFVFPPHPGARATYECYFEMKERSFFPPADHYQPGKESFPCGICSSFVGLSHNDIDRHKRMVHSKHAPIL
jgi:hypothetical protein